MNNLMTGEMKKALKEAGYDLRKISIRHHFAGCSDAYNVIVDSTEYDLGEIGKLLRKFESVDRDEITGEVLAGGNTFVNVSHSTRAYLLIEKENDNYREAISEAVEKAGAKLKRIGFCHHWEGFDLWEVTLEGNPDRAAVMQELYPLHTEKRKVYIA